MLIVCPSCASEYTIDPARLGADGRTVRCAACHTKWFVAGPSDDLDTAPGISPEPQEDETFQGSEAADEPAPISVAASNARTPARPRGKVRRSPGPSAVAKTARRIGAALSGGLAMSILCVALAAGVVLDRAGIVRAMPDTARLYALVGLPVNLRGLDFRDVTSELVGDGSDRFLVVAGEIANVTARQVSVAPIEIAVRDAAGQDLYTWTAEPPRPSLDPSETARFRARLAAPPTEGRQVFVRFASAGGTADAQ